MVTIGSTAVGNFDVVSAVLSQVPTQLSGGFIELAILFFVLAIVAAVLGASGVAGISMQIAKWFIIIFIVLAIISMLL
ncbi:DUF1328 domain-containing protein [Halorubrum sp. DTA98]|uniref:DUF1328 domain-containing protein n=1 Tax=Halorubrum sp. DTA98 TaxID=3402163 RepID=UPI003AABF498